VRDKILKQPKGDSAFVELLLLAKDAGLDALDMACELTLERGTVTAAIVLNELRRLVSPGKPIALTNLPDGITLQHEPAANCGRYDHLRGNTYVNNNATLTTIH
jgi:hypothetical protein